MTKNIHVETLGPFASLDDCALEVFKFLQVSDATFEDMAAVMPAEEWLAGQVTAKRVELTGEGFKQGPNLGAKVFLPKHYLEEENEG